MMCWALRGCRIPAFQAWPSGLLPTDAISPSKLTSACCTPSWRSTKAARSAAYSLPSPHLGADGASQKPSVWHRLCQQKVSHHHGYRGQPSQRRAAQACACLVVYWGAGSVGAVNPLRQSSAGVSTLQDGGRGGRHHCAGDRTPSGAHSSHSRRAGHAD